MASIREVPFQNYYKLLLLKIITDEIYCRKITSTSTPTALLGRSILTMNSPIKQLVMERMLRPTPAPA
jgi:hypothetical protein